MENLEVINKRLLDNYGRGVAELPSYRVVWSSNEREVRTNVFLGTKMETEKYPMFPDCWILEHPQPNLLNEELDVRVSYEPLWVFAPELDADWEAIEKIIYFHIHRVAPKSAKALEHEHEEQKKLEAAKILDQLQHEDPFPKKMYDSDVVTVS